MLGTIVVIVVIIAIMVKMPMHFNWIKEYSSSVTCLPYLGFTTFESFNFDFAHSTYSTCFRLVIIITTIIELVKTMD